MECSPRDDAGQPGADRAGARGHSPSPIRRSRRDGARRPLVRSLSVLRGPLKPQHPSRHVRYLPMNCTPPAGQSSARISNRRRAAGRAVGARPSLRAQAEAAVQALSTGRVPLLWLEGSNCSGCSVSLAQQLSDPAGLAAHKTPVAAIPPDALHRPRPTRGRSREPARSPRQVHPRGRGRGARGDAGGVPLRGREFPGSPAACRAAAEPCGGGRQLRRVSAGSPPRLTTRSARWMRSTYLQGKGVSKPFIRVPGCPPHPDWMIGTLVHVIQFGILLGLHFRPLKFFGRTFHDTVRSKAWRKQNLRHLGCLEALGCKGPSTYADCAARGWNGVAMSCVQSLVAVYRLHFAEFRKIHPQQMARIMKTTTSQH